MTFISGISGAEAVMASLAASGVETCFMNPGTSELPLLRALDKFPQISGILTLFEGVTAGAADGYARITRRPSAVLLHMGSGLSNGLANLHSARLAHTPLLCVVGSHATHRAPFDAPLHSDMEAAARAVSGWVRTASGVRPVALDVIDALEATHDNGGQVATLVVPADVAWSPSVLPFSDREPRRPAPVASGILDAAVSAVQSELSTTILLGGPALSPAGLRAADRISQATDARILMETFPARIEQGAGMPSAQRLTYDPSQARAQLAQTQDLVLAGARPPISFYSCPDEPSELAPHGCRHLALGEPGQDIESALEFIADELADGFRPRVAPRTLQPKKKGRLSILPRAGKLSLHTMAQAIAATLPEDCIVVEETISSNAALGPAMARTTPHTLLTLIGGALGQGLPAATGAAIAAPDRPVLALESDGSVLFTIQALWPQAREHLNVTTVIINNSSCRILQAEFPRFGNQQAETAAERILELTDPSIDFVNLSEGLGVPARRVTTSEQLISALHDAYTDSGPHVIEAVVPRNA